MVKLGSNKMKLLLDPCKIILYQNGNFVYSVFIASLIVILNVFVPCSSVTILWFTFLMDYCF